MDDKELKLLSEIIEQLKQHNSNLEGMNDGIHEIMSAITVLTDIIANKK